MKSIKAFFVNITISVTSIALLLFLLEVTTRLVLYVNNRKLFAEVIKSLPPVKAGVEATLAHIIQPSIYPKIIYELRPNIDVNFYGTVRLNKQGWRNDTDFTITKPPNTIRIVGLGDSYMFGQGCDQNENALSFLEQLLNARFPQKKWEVINTAVPGYNTVMEVETLKRKMLIYQPDIVIIEYIANDMDLPNFIYDPINFIDIHRLFLLDFVMRRLQRCALNFKLYDAPQHIKGRGRFEYDPSGVPLQYKDMVGLEAFTKAMYELKTIQEKNHFQIICLVTWRNEEVFNLSKQLGFYTLYNEAYNPENKAVVLSDLHPNVIGHQKTALVILDFMMQKGIIKHFVGTK